MSTNGRHKIIFSQRHHTTTPCPHHSNKPSYPSIHRSPAFSKQFKAVQGKIGLTMFAPLPYSMEVLARSQSKIKNQEFTLPNPKSPEVSNFFSGRRGPRTPPLHYSIAPCPQCPALNCCKLHL